MMPPRRAARAAPAAAEAASSAFPSGLYGKYKQATQFFLDWLLRARSEGVAAADTKVEKGKNKSKLKDDGVALAVYEEIVAAIAREPAVLSPSLMRLWGRALAACETAITLRERVAVFFPTKAENETDSHAHFLERLRSWLQTLKGVTTPLDATRAPHVQDTESPVDFSNYYAVLELPDDYFPTEAADTKTTIDHVSKKSSTVSPVDSKKKFEQAFENDLNMELAFLFMELEELSEAVYDAFLDVKRHKKTLVEATVVAKAAIDSAKTVIAKLQLRFPAIRTGHDMMVMIRDRIPFEQLKDLMTTVLAAFAPRRRPSKIPQSQYSPGTIIADIMWVARALESFIAKPLAPNSNIFIPDGAFGETYSEERTPHYCAPNMVAMPSFWLQQLPLLYNTLGMNRARGIKKDSSSLSGWFLDQVDEYFTTRKVSIHLVFTMICWIRSVSALQGEGGLGRTVSLSISHRWDLEERLRASISHGKVLKANPALHKHMEGIMSNLQRLHKHDLICRANPLFAGFVLLDCQLRFLDIGAESLLISSRFHAFGHIYNALRDRQLLEGIPFIEELLQVYEGKIFAPSRASAVQGSYMRSYFVSSGIADASVDAMLRRRPHPPKHLAKRVRETYHLADISRLIRLLKQKDYSVLPTASSAASWKTILSAVSDLCTDELFDSRVLSRDMLKFSDDLAGTFNELCDALGYRDGAERLLQTAILRSKRQDLVHSVVEDGVVMPLLPFLDCLNVDGSIRDDKDAADILQLDGVKDMLLSIGGVGAIEGYCRRAASVISKRFGQRKLSEIEASYFSFPAVPKWSLLEFGDASLHDEPQPGTASERFCALMEMMERSNGPLSPSDLKKLKTMIKLEPAILGVGAIADSASEMCTLLHHAAAGPTRDLRLVEWLVQMGALRHQLQHCRHPPSLEVMVSNGIHGSQLFNALAVHCAAKAGSVDIVRLLLEADHMRDLNTVTFHTRESLAHLAVKFGHRELYEYLTEMGISHLHQDASGKHIYDLTSDSNWKRNMVVMAVAQRRRDEQTQSRKNPEVQTHREAEAVAAKLRRELASQREAERQKSETLLSRGSRPSERGDSVRPSATTTIGRGVVDAGFAIGTSSGENQSKQHVVTKGSHAEDPVTRVASWMQRIRVGGNDTATWKPESALVFQSQEASDARIETLRRALEELNEDPAATAAQREACAKTALGIVDFLRDTVQYLSNDRTKHDVMPVLREEVGLQASQAVFLLNKFYRRLPPSTYSRVDVWKPRPDESTLSSWEKLVKRAGPPVDFHDFLSFALPTAEVLASCRRGAQANEMVDLVERRLLKMKQRPPIFRGCVELYVMVRRENGIEPVGGSTPEARRALEWYASNHTGLDHINALGPIDQLCGFQWFFKLRHTHPASCVELDRFLECLEGSSDPDLDSVVFLDGYIVAGSDTRNDLARARRVVVDRATECGVKFNDTESVMETTKLSLVGFEFSATGIVREQQHP